MCVLHVRANFYICLPFIWKLPKDLFTIMVVPCIIILNHFKSLLSLSYYHFLVHTNNYLIYIYILDFYNKFLELNLSTYELTSGLQLIAGWLL